MKPKHSREEFVRSWSTTNVNTAATKFKVPMLLHTYVVLPMS